MKRSAGLLVGGATLLVGLSAGVPDLSQLGFKATAQARVYMLPRQKRVLRRVSFAQLPGWQSDDHSAAFAAFRRSCAQIDSMLSRARGRRLSEKYRAFRKVCRKGRAAGRTLSPLHARRFFETNFIPFRVRKTRTERLLTGYYEPQIEGSRVKTAKFNVPIYRKPDDLVVLSSAAARRKARRAGVPRSLFAARRTKGGRLVPYYTRAEIDRGALAGRGLELLYLADEIDAFFLHIQGSGRIVFPDGSSTRIAFAAKNGYPYTSIGKYMIAKGLLRRDEATLENMKRWLRADIKRARRVLWQNKSYIFFRELPGNRMGPIGAQRVELTPVRSLAVDKRYHPLGTPIFVNVPGLRGPDRKPFRRLMIAQDVGSAIKGPERGDIYWGSGDLAGELAGVTGHEGDFYVLLPKY